MALVLLLILLACCCSLSVAAQEEKLVWSDEFHSSGAPNPLVWEHDIGGGGWGNGEIQTYDKDNVKVENGNLVISVTSETDDWNGRTFSSGRIRSNARFEFQYGTVVAKMKVPKVGNGLWPAFWMLGTTFPQVEWPLCGEIDVMELGSARALQLDKATTRLGSAIHWQASSRNQQQYNELDVDFDLSDDYHLYKLEWTPERITTYVNDIPIVDKNISNMTCFECEELHQPYFFIINMAVGGGYTRIYHEWGITADLPAELLVDYIRLYDNGYTQLSGSFAETLPPTSSPLTVSPTSSSTPSPTDTDERDDEPDSKETKPPTVSPTASSPASPSSTPPPTDSPTVAEQEQRSLRPTTLSTPSTLSIQRLEATGIRMTFTNVLPLNPMSVKTWSTVTRDFLVTQVTTAIGLVESVKVKVSLASQDPPYVFRTRRRGLQDDTKQELTFDAVFEIQSVVDIQDVNRYIIGAFNTLEKKVSYLSTLQASDKAFENANDVVVAPATSISRVVQNPNSSEENGGLGIGLTIGIVLAALAIVCLVAAVFYSRRRKALARKKRKQKSSSERSQHQESPTAKAYRDDDSLYDIPVETPSTCEESLYTSPSKGTLDFQFTCPRGGTSKQEQSIRTSDSSIDFAEYIASFRHRDPEPVVMDDSESEFTAGSQTYDYSAAYKNMQGSIADSQSQMTGQATQDDQTIVAEFAVKAPPGNLGITLVSSDEGIPIVESVKESSPLVGQVNTGDRLLSVDGRDVSMVLATTVSRIIASKKNNPSRQFVFARPMEI